MSNVPFLEPGRYIPAMRGFSTYFIGRMWRSHKYTSYFFDKGGSHALAGGWEEIETSPIRCISSSSLSSNEKKPLTGQSSRNEGRRSSIWGFHSHAGRYIEQLCMNNIMYYDFLFFLFSSARSIDIYCLLEYHRSISTGSPSTSLGRGDKEEWI